MSPLMIVILRFTAAGQCWRPASLARVLGAGTWRYLDSTRAARHRIHRGVTLLLVGFLL